MTPHSSHCPADTQCHAALGDNGSLGAASYLHLGWHFLSFLTFVPRTETFNSFKYVTSYRFSKEATGPRAASSHLLTKILFSLVPFHEPFTRSARIPSACGEKKLMKFSSGNKRPNFVSPTTGLDPHENMSQTLEGHLHCGWGQLAFWPH